jgi:predicted CopG family antitoxin
MSYKLKTIAISECNYSALKSLGKAGDSFNDVISKLLLDSSNKAIKDIQSAHHAADRRRRGGEEAR